MKIYGPENELGIEFMNLELRFIKGYSDKETPNIGDRFDIELSSGKIARFEFTLLEKSEDDGHFFAQVKDVGYISDNVKQKQKIRRKRKRKRKRF